MDCGFLRGYGGFPIHPTIKFLNLT